MVAVLALVALFVLGFGPWFTVIYLASRAPAPKPPDPVRPFSLIMTVVVVLIVLLPAWAVVVGESGGDVIALVEAHDDAIFFLYGALPFLVWAAWVSNGSSRARAHPWLSRIHGFVTLVMVPSFVVFAFVVESYDPMAHT